MATNLDSVYYCARAAGLHFRRQAKEQTTVHGEKLEGFSRGSFVATASMSGHIVNFPHVQTAYNASKAGVIHMCKNPSLSSQTKQIFLPIVHTTNHLCSVDICDRQISRGRMGGLRAREHRVAWLY